MGCFEIAWCSKLVESWKWYNDPSKNHSMNTKPSCFRARNRKQECTNDQCRLTRSIFPGNVYLLKINTNSFVQINFYFSYIIKLYVRRLEITFFFFFLFSLALHIQINTASACLLSFDRYVVYVFIRDVNNFWNGRLHLFLNNYKVEFPMFE